MSYVASKYEMKVTDLEASIAFYRDTLKFTLHEARVAERDDGRRLYHVPLSKGPVLLALGPFDDLPESHHFRKSKPGSSFGVGCEFCLYIPASELELLYENVVATTQNDIVPLGMRPWGARDFRVADPDGFYIRVSEPDADTTYVADLLPGLEGAE